MACRHEGRDEECRADFDQLIAKRPDDAYALNNRAWLNVLVGDFERARADADQADALLPNHASTLGTRCFALAGLGEMTRARADCVQSLKLSPAEALNLGMLAYFDKRYPDARKFWNQALADAPSDRRAVEPWLARMKK